MLRVPLDPYRTNAPRLGLTKLSFPSLPCHRSNSNRLIEDKQEVLIAMIAEALDHNKNHNW
jgi:hypothetical protein